MESCELAGGGVAVKTRETVAPVVQLTTQPPPETPLQEERAKESSGKKSAVQMGRMEDLRIAWYSVFLKSARRKPRRRVRPPLNLQFTTEPEPGAAIRWSGLPNRARGRAAAVRACLRAAKRARIPMRPAAVCYRHG